MISSANLKNIACTMTGEVELRMTWFEAWWWWLIAGTIISLIVLVPIYIILVRGNKRKASEMPPAQPKTQSSVCEYCGSPMAQTDIVCNKCGRARSQKMEY